MTSGWPAPPKHPAGWAQSRIGPAISASLAEKPELSTTAILLVAIPETMAILGFVVAVLIRILFYLMKPMCTMPLTCLVSFLFLIQMLYRILH